MARNTINSDGKQSMSGTGHITAAQKTEKAKARKKFEDTVVTKVRKAAERSKKRAAKTKLKWENLLAASIKTAEKRNAVEKRDTSERQASYRREKGK